MGTKDHSGDSESQGSLDDDADFIELRRRIARLQPERRDQLSDWLQEQKLTDLSSQLDHALRIFNYAGFDNQTGPFGNIEASD